MIKAVCYRAESTIKAMNSTAKYGLENLNNVHAAFSIGFAITQDDNATITAPEAIAVHKYTAPTIGSLLSVTMKKGVIENNTMTNVEIAITLDEVFSD